jgi:hypothetical protein
MRSFSEFGVLMIATLLAQGCGRKGAECEIIVGSMKRLGKELAVAQKVTSSKNSKLDQVAAALRPFAAAAKDTGEVLAASELTTPELKKIAKDASEAALALAESSTKMADAAERMKGIDAARRAVNIRKTFVDAGETRLHELCTPATRECAPLLKVQFDAPAIPETPDDLQAKQAWANQVNIWTSRLASVRVSNPDVNRQTASLIQSWKSFASAMTALATLSDEALGMDEASKVFSTQINSANAAMNAASKVCGL